MATIYDLSKPGLSNLSSYAGNTEALKLQKSILEHFDVSHTDEAFTGTVWRFGQTPSKQNRIEIQRGGKMAVLFLALDLAGFESTKVIAEKGIGSEVFSCANLYKQEIAQMNMGAVSFGVGYHEPDHQKKAMCVISIDINDLGSNDEKLGFISNLLNYHVGLRSK
ncbi:hypothetical protein [Vibrio owensii]|uniref:hypothetical protein n=1 Tax=Vibrio owensii TaxID=696485 RepID=UPI0018F1BE6C|nr:hypothetical protein [Vibrio owensii]